MKIISRMISFLSFVFIGCSTVKIYEKYGEETELVDNNRSKILIEKFTAFDKNKSFLTFTSDFNNLITVKNGDSLVFNKKRKTLSMLGFTDGCIILNNKDVMITIDKRQDIKLNKEQLSKYKFIYIAKEKNHYTIEYTNRAISFL